MRPKQTIYVWSDSVSTRAEADGKRLRLAHFKSDPHRPDSPQLMESSVAQSGRLLLCVSAKPRAKAFPLRLNPLRKLIEGDAFVE